MQRKSKTAKSMKAKRRKVTRIPHPIADAFAPEMVERSARDPRDLPPVPATPPRRPTALISPDLLTPSNADRALLTDVRHYCDVNQLSFADLDRSAREHYAAETRKQWVPWQLAPDSDPQHSGIGERFILVNADDEGEEHPGQQKFLTAEAAHDYAVAEFKAAHPAKGAWASEIKYLSAERKATTGYAVLRDPQGEYAGTVPEFRAAQIVDALNSPPSHRLATLTALLREASQLMPLGTKKRADWLTRAASAAAPIAGGLDQDGPEAEAYREAAHKEHVREGELEIDHGAIVSASEEGAYIAAWVWVDRPGKADDAS